jgi:hypothetical protein
LQPEQEHQQQQRQKQPQHDTGKVTGM